MGMVRQAQVGVVLAQQQAVLGARGMQPVRLDGRLGDQVVDQHADVGLVAPQDERRRRHVACSAALMPAMMPCAAASS